MIRTRSLAAALLWCLLSATTLLAQANPLDVIPDSALGFAVIGNLDDANQRLANVTQKMQLPVPDLLTMVRGFVGFAEGLDEKGGMAVALVSGPEGKEWEQSALCVVVPVTDYQAFVAPFEPEDPDALITSVTVAGMPMLVGNKGSFAVFAFAEREERLKELLTAAKTIQADVDPLRSWMADKQLALVVTSAGTRLLFQSILAAIPDAGQLKRDAAIGVGNPQAQAFQSVGEMFGMFKELLAAADEELTHLAVGLRIEDDASLRLAGRALFVKDGKLAAWSKNVQVPREGLLAGVPDGKFAFAYGGVSAHFSPEMWALISRFSDMGMQVIGLDDEKRKQYSEIAQQVQAGKRFTGGVMGMMRPGDSLFSTAVSIEHVKHADEHVKHMRQMFELILDGQKNPKTGERLYELADIKIGELEAMELVTRLGAMAQLDDANNAGGPPVQGIFDKLFGSDGAIRMYVAQADEHTVVTAYSKEQLVRGVKHVRSGGKGLADDADVAKTMALLPDGAQWVAYVSPQGLIQWVSVLVEALLGGEARLPAFAATEPIGLAARVSETGLDAEIVVPDGVVAGIGQYIGVLGQMFQNGGVPLP